MRKMGGNLKGSKMRILMIIAQFEPIIGGAEKQAKKLAQALARRGIKVGIITGWWKFGTLREETMNGMRIVRNFSCWGMLGIKRMRFLGAFFYALSLGIYLVLHRREYDIIHVHQVLYPAFVSAFVGKGILKKPIIAKMGCSGLTSDIRNIRRLPLGNLQLQYLVRKMDRLVTVNEEGGKEFHAIGYPLSKIWRIPNGAALRQDRKISSDRINYIITTVRLDHQKGIDILLRAWARVAANQKGLKLLVIGKGPQETEYKKLSQSLGTSDSVKFMGEVPQVEDYLEKADIFVLASRAEGMSNSLLEAMGYGLTCIATNISGNLELLGEGAETRIAKGAFEVTSRGILVNPEDAEGLSKAIVCLARDRELRESLGGNARKHIEQYYSIDSIAERYIDLYRHLLQGPN